MLVVAETISLYCLQKRTRHLKYVYMHRVVKGKLEKFQELVMTKLVSRVKGREEEGPWERGCVMTCNIVPVIV